MAAGTWNQGDLEKRVTKIDLETEKIIRNENRIAPCC